jgi:hypothetical protein
VHTLKYFNSCINTDIPASLSPRPRTEGTYVAATALSYINIARAGDRADKDRKVAFPYSTWA